MQKSTTPSKRGGSWIWQALTGILLILLLGLHMIAQHFVVSGGLRTFQDVIDYLRNPAMLILEVIFMLVVTYHAMVGVRAILYDFGMDEEARKKTTTVLTVLGVLIVAWAAYLLFRLTRM